jgi:hypothetical protein
MFGTHKLLREGAEATAVITAADYTVSNTGWHVELTVPFPDGSTGSLSCKVDRKHLLLPSPGDQVPVRYDPKDHSRIVVDTPALDARRAAAVAALKQLESERAHRVTDAIRNSPPGTMELGPLEAPDPDEDPRIGIARMSIRAAKRRGDLAEVNRLNEQIARLRAGAFEPEPAHRDAPPTDRLDRLQKLADLRSQGVLTDAEFAAEKARILAES